MRLPGIVVIAHCLALCGAACGGARNEPDDIADAMAMGRYAFTAEIPSGQRLAGFIDVAPDTIVARPQGIECRVAPQQPSSAMLVYDCIVPGTTGVSLLIDRRNPARKSTWVVSTQVVKKRDKCTEYRTWENGTRSCMRSEPEEYFETSRQQGSLVVTR